MVSTCKNTEITWDNAEQMYFILEQNLVVFDVLHWNSSNSHFDIFLWATFFIQNWIQFKEQTEFLKKFLPMYCVTVIHQSDSPLVPLWAKRTARVEILAAPQQRDGERSVSPGLRLSPHLPNNLHVPVSHQSQCFYNLVGSSKVSSSGLYFLRSEFHLGSFLSREFWLSISGAALPENITEILRENTTGWRHRKLISASTRNGTSVQTKDITSFIDRTVGSSNMEMSSWDFTRKYSLLWNFNGNPECSTSLCIEIMYLVCNRKLKNSSFLPPIIDFLHRDLLLIFL